MFLESGSKKGSLEILRTTPELAFKYTSNIFSQNKRDISEELPNFDHNYRIVQTRFSQGYNQRKDMPAIDDNDIKSLKKSLINFGINVKIVSIKANELIPLQDQVYLSKSIKPIAKKGAKKSKEFVSNRTIIISSDKYIIDGHHRYLSAMLNDPNIKMKTLMIDLPINKLLKFVKDHGDSLGNKRNL